MSKELKGIVYKSTGMWYTVKSEDDGQFYQARLKGKLKLDDLKLNNPIGVGDVVTFLLNKEDCTIDKILPRHNYIIRKSVHKTAHQHLIATNLDQCILLATLTQPRTSLGFIDRFLVAAESFRIPTLVVFNKSDLYSESDMTEYEILNTLYASLGYPTLLISCEKDEAWHPIKDVLKGKRTLISGHSGVGKSTLLNLLIPEARQRTSEISNYAQKGTHTTTFAEAFDLAFADGLLIDTPGIKEFGLSSMDKYELGHYFPEFRQLLGTCKFDDCLHLKEPGCQVVEGIRSGSIALSRYESYLSMLDDDDNRR